MYASAKPKFPSPPSCRAERTVSPAGSSRYRDLSARFSGNAGGTTENFFALSFETQGVFSCICAFDCRGRCLHRPAQNSPFLQNSSANSQLPKRADRVVDPCSKVSLPPVLRRGGRLCPPAEYTDFTGISGDFAASQRADVGIGPYEHAGNCILIRLRFPL